VRDSATTISVDVALRTVMGRRSIVTSGGMIFPPFAGTPKFIPLTINRSYSLSTLALVITSCDSCAVSVATVSIRTPIPTNERFRNVIGGLLSCYSAIRQEHGHSG
jgi:hypothetical protein